MAGDVAHLTDVMDALHHFVVIDECYEPLIGGHSEEVSALIHLLAFEVIDDFDERFECQSSILCGNTRIHYLKLFSKVAETIDLSESIDVTQKIEVLHNSISI